MPRRPQLPDPSNLVPPSQTGIEGDPDPQAVPADGVDSTPETEIGDADRVRVDPDPAEAPGRAAPDPEPGARRNEPSWAAAAPNRANPTLLFPLSGAGPAGWPGPN